MTSYDIPVALFLFKRKDTVLKIIDVLKKSAPKKIYLISDEGRDEDERAVVHDVRDAVIRAIDWDCEVVRDFADENRGVYANIALGALRVFEREERAVFLEDDNLPADTFLDYAREMLERFADEEKVLWVCGTSYFTHFESKYDAVFTQHLLPCGWASWRDKFVKLYDKDLKLLTDDKAYDKFRSSYADKALFRQQSREVVNEALRAKAGERYASWDYHMVWSVRAQGLYGVAPCHNQIKNIGVDGFSAHGGSSLENVMTRRFCGVETEPMRFPVKMPDTVAPEKAFEKKTGAVIRYPLKIRLRAGAVLAAKHALGIPVDEPIRAGIRRKFKKS